MLEDYTFKYIESLFSKVIDNEELNIDILKKFLQEKLKNMSQMERIKYQCEKIFNFYKHSKKFKDCTLQVYVAESEAAKIQLEKEVLLAQLESSKLKLKTAKLELEISVRI